MSLVSNDHELWEIQRKLQYDLHQAEAENTSDIFLACTVKSITFPQFTVTPTAWKSWDHSASDTHPQCRGGGWGAGTSRSAQEASVFCKWEERSSRRRLWSQGHGRMQWSIWCPPIRTFPYRLWEGHDLFPVVEAQNFTMSQESWPLAMDTGRVTEHTAKKPWWLEAESWRHLSLQQPAAVPKLPLLGAWEEGRWWRTEVQMCRYHTALLMSRAIFSHQYPDVTQPNGCWQRAEPREDKLQGKSVLTRKKGKRVTPCLQHGGLTNKSLVKALSPPSGGQPWTLRIWRSRKWQRHSNLSRKSPCKMPVS